MWSGGLIETKGVAPVTDQIVDVAWPTVQGKGNRVGQHGRVYVANTEEAVQDVVVITGTLSTCCCFI